MKFLKFVSEVWSFRAYDSAVLKCQSKHWIDNAEKNESEGAKEASQLGGLTFIPLFLLSVGLSFVQTHKFSIFSFQLSSYFLFWWWSWSFAYRRNPNRLIIDKKNKKENERVFGQKIEVPKRNDTLIEWISDHPIYVVTLFFFTVLIARQSNIMLNYLISL